MLKMVKLAVSVLLTAVIVSSSLFTASASNSKQDYLDANTVQKEYYVGTYVPSYNAYRQALKDLRIQIRNTHFETKEQAQRVIDFLNNLKASHADFFGTRDTVGKSRYDVPAARQVMYQAADKDKNYTVAIQYCQTLKSLVEARVGFLNGIRQAVQNFELLPGTQPTQTSPSSQTTTTKATSSTTVTTTTATTTTTTTTTTASNPIDATVVFHANEVWSSYSFGFEIRVTNNTKRDVSDWTLWFNYSGATINTIWVDKGSLVLNLQSNKVTISPLNQYQGGYTIPANSTLVLKGGANGNAANVSVSNAHFNNQAVSIVYTR